MTLEVSRVEAGDVFKNWWNVVKFVESDFDWMVPTMISLGLSAVVPALTWRIEAL